MVNDIKDIMNMECSEDLASYLGVKLQYGPIQWNHYDHLIDKVEARLEGWRAKHLSMAGRVVLIKSVTSAIPLYEIQRTKILVRICDRLDKLNRNFLWGDSSEKRALHLVNWEQVCRPKHEGGLGIRRMRQMNIALLTKAVWSLVMKQNLLWTSVLRGRYVGRDNLDFHKSYPVSCKVWRSIMAATKEMEGKVRWRVGNGHDIKFWSDHWVGKSPLISDLEEEYCDLINPEDTVADYISNGEWNYTRLREVIDEERINDVLALPIPQLPHTGDTLVWDFEENGRCSVSRVYHSLMEDIVDDEGQNLEWIWRLEGLAKWRGFIWLAWYDRLVTNKLRVTCHVSHDSSCSLCLHPVEDCLHILRDCSLAHSFWIRLIPPSRIASFMSSDLQTWLPENLTCRKLFSSGAIPWSIYFLAACWYMWKWRCSAIFDNSFTRPVNGEFIIWREAQRVHEVCSKAKGLLKPYRIVPLQWEKPVHGMLKLNVDAAKFAQDGVASYGGVLRDSHGA